MSVEKSIHYIAPEDASRLIDVVVERVKVGDIPSVVVASRKGNAAVSLGKALEGSAGVVSVTEFTYSEGVKKAMKKQKVTAVEKADLPIQDRRMMREALEMFGSGVKAALEVASIAAEKGLASGKTLAVAGGRGALDTALVVRPAAPADLTDPDPKKRMAVLEILALPVDS
ncbi:MAG: hypothetical protein PVJ38_03795 [Candidatus Bathyarchaeota archaeon]|jgi:hypothetical protein